jgi:hypothetical protein
MPPENMGPNNVPPRHTIPHYHGDEVKVLFLVGALITIFAQSTGADLPLSTGAAVLAAALLVIAAGITNPNQIWIHWVNAFFAFVGTILFGRYAITHFRDGSNIIDPSFIYVEALALISLIALYFTTRTIRGILMRPRLR